MKTESNSSYRRIFGFCKALFIFLAIMCVILWVVTLYSCMREGRAADITEKPSVAVISVPSSMCDPELEYISAGMHDAIISELGSINSLLVKSSAATQKYHNSELTGQQIANELGANIIVKHSLVCTAEGQRLLIQLIQVSPEEKEIWSGTYELDLANSFNIYRAIAQQITKGVHADITPQERARLNTPRPVNPELYRNYLQGIFYMNKMTSEGFKQGLKYLNQAMAIDPKDPLPYLGLALSFSNAAHASDAGDEGQKQAKAYALKALELDSTLAEAYTVLATDYLYYQWDYPATEDALKKAIELNPNISSLHYTMGWYLGLTGQLDEAVEEMKLAISIDPLDPFCTGYLSWFCLWIGRYEDAISWARKTLDLDPNYPMGLYVLGSAYAELGNYDQAIETHKKGASISIAHKCGLGVAYARAGRREEALEVAAELEKVGNYWFTWGLADIYVALEDKEKAIHWIEAAYEQHHDFVPWFRINPYYKTLFDDPRFQAVIDRLNLPPLVPEAQLVSVD